MMRTLQKVKQRVSSAEHYVKWRLGLETHPSVFFYTFHKCASTLFSQYVLKNVDGLRNVDYASRIYTGKISGNNLQFEETGHVYGPIRLSAEPLSPVFTKLVQPACDPNFVAGRTGIFLIRDPRDILVSAYYSFGVSHGLSRVPEIRTQQQARRDSIQSMTVDEYAIAEAPSVLANFQNLNALAHACQEHAVLKYEDMIDNFDVFSRDLRRCLPLTDAVVAEIHNQSRPAEKEDVTVHRRSGRTGGYVNKLEPATIATINKTLAPVLDLFGYSTSGSNA